MDRADELMYIMDSIINEDEDYEISYIFSVVEEVIQLGHTRFRHSLNKVVLILYGKLFGINTYYHVKQEERYTLDIITSCLARHYMQNEPLIFRDTQLDTFETGRIVLYNKIEQLYRKGWTARVPDVVSTLNLSVENFMKKYRYQLAPLIELTELGLLDIDKITIDILEKITGCGQYYTEGIDTHKYYYLIPLLLCTDTYNYSNLGLDEDYINEVLIVEFATLDSNTLETVFLQRQWFHILPDVKSILTLYKLCKVGDSYV